MDLEHQVFKIAYIRGKRYIAIALVDLCYLGQVKVWHAIVCLGIDRFHQKMEQEQHVDIFLHLRLLINNLYDHRRIRIQLDTRF